MSIAALSFVLTILVVLAPVIAVWWITDGGEWTGYDGGDSRSEDRLIWQRAPERD